MSIQDMRESCENMSVFKIAILSMHNFCALSCAIDGCPFDLE
jgi:hypothetical protein